MSQQPKLQMSDNELSELREILGANDIKLDAEYEVRRFEWEQRIKLYVSLIVTGVFLITGIALGLVFFAW